MMNFHSSGDAARRREEILRIVRESTVHSQDDILSALRKRGVQVTQPTLSRDLRELGLAKSPAGYVVPGDIATVTRLVPREVRETRLDQLLRDAALSAEAGGNLVVIKTPPAAAQPVASAIDSTPVDGLLGTIGGDDTIFLAFRTSGAAADFAHHIQLTAGLNPPSRRRPRA